VPFDKSKHFGVEHVIVRDPKTFAPLPIDQTGLLQGVSLIPKSYPGHSGLTEDLGARDWSAARIPELRGCSDVIAAAAIKAYLGGGRFLDVDFADVLAHAEQSRLALAPPFSANRTAIVTDVSARLLATRRIVDRPATAYFAHWTRRAAIRDLAARFEASAMPGTLAAPRTPQR